MFLVQFFQVKIYARANVFAYSKSALNRDNDMRKKKENGKQLPHCQLDMGSHHAMHHCMPQSMISAFCCDGSWLGVRAPT